MAYEDSTTSGVRQTVAPAAARTTSSNTGALSSHGHTTIRAQLNVTAASGTTPTLDVIIEDSLDNGATWNTIGTFAQKTVAAREVINITTPFAPTIRARWTIAGTTPSFTFAIDWYATK